MTRTCFDGSECINPKRCGINKPCWWEIQKRDHEIIFGEAERAVKESLDRIKKKLNPPTSL